MTFVLFALVGSLLGLQLIQFRLDFRQLSFGLVGFGACLFKLGVIGAPTSETTASNARATKAVLMVRSFLSG
jgi:hypothetical protein